MHYPPAMCVAPGSPQDLPEFWPRACLETGIEYNGLHRFLDENGLKGETAVEFGCGFGRMLPCLNFHYRRVWGYEHDSKLVAIAQGAGLEVSEAHLESVRTKAELAMTYTTLLCLPDDLCKKVLTRIRMTATQAIVLVETTEPDRNPKVYSRTPETYSAWLGMPLTASMPKPGLRYTHHTQMLWRISHAT